MNLFNRNGIKLALASLYGRFVPKRKPPTFNDILQKRVDGPKPATPKEVAGVIATNTVPLACRSNRAHRYGLRKYTWGVL